jgi:hypothetical protein
MTPAEILEKAADLIEANGFWKNQLWGPEGQCCSVGAVMKATGSSISLDSQTRYARGEAVKALGVTLGLVPADVEWPEAWSEVVGWNNVDERTADDVVDAMRRAAKDLRNEVTL